MVADMAALCEKYPSLVTVSSIGTSELGVDIPVMLLGDPNAPYQVLLQGAVHGREHMTAWLLMAMADYWLDNSLFSYGKVCYHIIPMVNPDGVAISQNRTLNDAQREIYFSDLAYGFTTQSESDYAYNWKANGLGVDINRNFPSGWETINNRLLPSSEGFQGLQPFSTAEAAALRDYTLLYPFNATVNYHAFGSIIYYEYGSKEPVNSQSSSLASTVKRATGYPLVGSSGVAAAGYKDWAISKLNIPSLTIEVGYGKNPVPDTQFDGIWNENKDVWAAMLYNLKN
jgi:g-D-glutamyl-meso-diaminopimelate peptidase